EALAIPGDVAAVADESVPAGEAVGVGDIRELHAARAGTGGGPADVHGPRSGEGRRHRRCDQREQQLQHQGTIATARVGPALPPTILSGKHDTVKPVSGSAPRLNRRSIWQKAR